MATNLPALQQKAQTISEYLGRDYIKKQLAMALPKHLTVDRLLRVAMTTIRHNRKLLDCTLESLLASIMGCAQLGLEPEPALGQAYLVPYWNAKKNCLEAQLIPGYRGYITLARRSGEVQTVSAQVVYTNDHFKLQYGLKETLDHIPADGDRGKPKGAYVVFRYKDGSHSFDYMTIADIEKIKERSKGRNKAGELTGPWVTDEDEMRKKTVIRRHIKLVPLSVEMATAAAAEEKAFAGESQAGLFLDTQEGEFTEVDEATAVEDFAAQVDKQGLTDLTSVEKYIAEIAKVNQQTIEAVKAQAGTPENFSNFWESFLRWQKPDDSKRHRRTKAEIEAEKAASKAGGIVAEDESVHQTGTSMEVPTTDTTEAHTDDSASAPTVDELLASLEAKGWPRAKVMIKFGTNWQTWTDDQKVKVLADLLAAQE